MGTEEPAGTTEVVHDTGGVVALDPGLGGEKVEMDGNDLAKKGRHRPRKKKLYSEVCQQIEFYFSDSNVSKNRGMLDMLNASEYVELGALLTFNKLNKMVPNLSLEFLQKALANSEMLELSSDRKGVKRKVPYDPNKLKTQEEIEKCTIYIENVPSSADHEWVAKIFQEFGPTAYVAVPKFKHNGLCKGFAFVEFQEQEAADRCLKAYGDIGACLPDNLNPENLISIKTHEPGTTPDRSEAPAVKSEAGVSLETRKRIHEGDKDDEASVAVKREKIADGSGEEDLEEGKEVDDDQNNSHEKKRRRKMYKTKKVEDMEKQEGDLIQLKILPKRLWRQLRNRYLNLQRDNLGKLKRQLRASDRRIHGGYQRPRQEAEPPVEAPQQNQQKNVLVRLELQEPLESSEALRTMIVTEMLSENQAKLLKYVDYNPPESDTRAVVRLDGHPKHFEAVGEFLRSAPKKFKSFSVLTESQAKNYWAEARSKMQADPKKKVRGRDKLLQEAMKTATHIRFSDEDDKNGVQSDVIKLVA